jgi:cell division cycle 14
LPILPFNDATYCKQEYELTVLNCLQGLQKAIEMGWYDKNMFDAYQYRLLDDPGTADMHFLSPDFVAFKGPSERKTKLMAGVYTMTPRHYSSIFSKLGITDVLRLNEPNTYQKQTFVERGIRHHDLYFDDCTVPSNAIALKFLKLAETIIDNGGKLAVHCKAGLGRTGTLIALHWMKHCGFTASECIGWQRIVRPGCVIGQQQQYLHWAEEQLGVTKTSRMTEPGLRDEPRQAMSAEESAILGLEVAAAQNLRSGQRANSGRGI